MSLHPAARVTDVFGHDATLAGIDTGVVLGALLAVGIIATGGLTAIAVGAALVTIGAGRMAGAAQACSARIGNDGLWRGDPQRVVQRFHRRIETVADLRFASRRSGQARTLPDRCAGREHRVRATRDKDAAGGI